MKQSKKQTNLKAYNYLLASGVLWGFVGLFYKQGLAVLSISVFLAIRFTIGAVALFMTQRHRFKKISLATFIVVALFALLDAILINYVYSFAIERTTLLHASIILLLEPFIVYFFAALMLKEQPHRIVIIGSLIAATGMGIIIHYSVNSSMQEGALLGDIALVGYAAINAFAIVFGRKLLARKHVMPPEQFGFIEYIVAAVVISSVVTLTSGWSEVVAISLTTWFWIFAAAIIGGAMPIVLYYRSVKQLPAERLADIAFISPAVAATVGVVFLGESLTAGFVLGTSIVVIGLLVSHKKIHPILVAHKLGAGINTLEKTFAIPQKAYQYITIETKKTLGL